MAITWARLRRFEWLFQLLGYSLRNQLLIRRTNCQTVFYLLMFLFLTVCVARGCCCWSAAGHGQDYGLGGVPGVGLGGGLGGVSWSKIMFDNV